MCIKHQHHRMTLSKKQCTPGGKFIIHTKEVAYELWTGDLE